MNIVEFYNNKVYDFYRCYDCKYMNDCMVTRYYKEFRCIISLIPKCGNCECLHSSINHCNLCRGIYNQSKHCNYKKYT